MRRLSHIFNCNACVYQTATRWDLGPYPIAIWVIDWWCNVCLFTWWIDTRFLLQRFDIGNWRIWTRIYCLVLQADRLIKCASHPYPLLVLPSFNKTTQFHRFINKFDSLSLIFQQKRPTPTYSYPYLHYSPTKETCIHQFSNYNRLCLPITINPLNELSLENIIFEHSRSEKKRKAYFINNQIYPSILLYMFWMERVGLVKKKQFWYAKNDNQFSPGILWKNWHLKRNKKRNFKRLYLKSYGEFRVKTNIFKKFIQFSSKRWWFALPTWVHGRGLYHL